MTSINVGRKAPLIALLLAASTFLAGCTDFACTPTQVPTTVTLDLVREEARTLPILTSGETRLAGQPLPDSHGRLEFEVNIDHPGLTNESLNFTDIQIHAFRLTVQVANLTVPVEVLRVEGGQGWTRIGKNQWDGNAVDGSRLAAWWTVDRDASPSPAAVLLQEGAPYVATVAFDWIHESCVAKASGHLETPFSDFIEASANARTFASVTAPRLHAASGTAAIAAEYRIVSGLDVEVTEVAARAVFLGLSEARVGVNASTETTVDAPLEGTADTRIGVGARLPLPVVGLATFPIMSWNASGEARDVVTPSDNFNVHSAVAGSRDHAPSGTVISSAASPQPGVYVVTVDITYQPTDATLGVQTDSFVYAIVVE